MIDTEEVTVFYEQPTTTFGDLLIAAYGAVPYESAMGRDYAVAIHQPDSGRVNYQDLPGGCGRCIMAVMAGIDNEAFPDGERLTNIACINFDLPSRHTVFDEMESEHAEAIACVIDRVISANDDGLLVNREDREILMQQMAWVTSELATKITEIGGVVRPPGRFTHRVLALP